MNAGSCKVHVPPVTCTSWPPNALTHRVHASGGGGDVKDNSNERAENEYAQTLSIKNESTNVLIFSGFEISWRYELMRHF